MRIVKMENGKEMITTEESPRPLGRLNPFASMITMQDVAKRAAEKKAADEKAEADKEGAKSEK